MFAKDIAEGMLTLNPITLKRFETDQFKPLLGFIRKVMGDVQAAGYPHNQPDLIRTRNLKLQRLNQAASIIETVAREKKINLF